MQEDRLVVSKTGMYTSIVQYEREPDFTSEELVLTSGVSFLHSDHSVKVKPSWRNAASQMFVVVFDARVFIASYSLSCWVRTCPVQMYMYLA